MHIRLVVFACTFMVGCTHDSGSNGRSKPVGTKSYQVRGAAQPPVTYAQTAGTQGDGNGPVDQGSIGTQKLEILRRIKDKQEQIANSKKDGPLDPEDVRDLQSGQLRERLLSELAHLKEKLRQIERKAGPPHSAAPFVAVKMVNAQNADVRGTASDPGPRAVLVIHGGCGVISRRQMSDEMERQHRAALEDALRAGFAELQKPEGTSLKAVEAAIKIMEDSPLFNAGKGAALTREGRIELDASLMDGRTKQAGAVASVTTIKNPISAARAVMEKSGHVLMVGEGAERFAHSLGVQRVANSYFVTPLRQQQYEEAMRLERQQETKPASRSQANATPPNRFGTVGAVALDAAGNLAAGTSTGGLSMKRPGRVGDSPLIGAGNYASNQSCAVSATGDGEFFIRAVAAHDISTLVEYKGLSPIAACNEVIHRKLKNAGGEGGVIALSRQGEAALSFNTDGMYRGYITAAGKTHVFIYE